MVSFASEPELEKKVCAIAPGASPARTRDSSIVAGGAERKNVL